MGFLNIYNYANKTFFANPVTYNIGLNQYEYYYIAHKAIYSYSRSTEISGEGVLDAPH